MGQRVYLEDEIGTQGKKGVSGEHVHFEARSGSKTSAEVGSDLELRNSEPYSTIYHYLY